MGPRKPAPPEDEVVGPGIDGQPSGAINGKREDETVVIVRVFADEIHPPGRPDDDAGFRAAVADVFALCGVEAGVAGGVGHERGQDGAHEAT